MSPHSVVSRGDARVVFQEAISSSPCTFSQFHDAKATFVDKTLAIEAFLRDIPTHHLILRPRHCGKSYTLSMIRFSSFLTKDPCIWQFADAALREFLQQPLKTGPIPGDQNINNSQFANTAITQHKDLVSQHFQQHPILYIDLKDVKGCTYEQMLTTFDKNVHQIIEDLSYPYSDLTDDKFCMRLRRPGAVQERRRHALTVVSQELHRVYDKRVIVLIDECDSPILSALQHGYAAEASIFFSAVFGSLLKGNCAVYSSMMVGIYSTVNSGWMSSSLNHLKIFPMHAEDDRYAKFFLFTETEVKILCETYKRLTIESLQHHYNGYTATYNAGFVKLYNPFSVVSAIEANKISNYWVETGENFWLLQCLWHASPQFHNKLDLLKQKSVELFMDEHIDFSSISCFESISDSGLWGLLYYTGYLTVESIVNQFRLGYILQIPNKEVRHIWVNQLTI